MGEVYIADECGRVLREAQNALTEDMEVRMLQAFGDRLAEAPTHCAVGASYADLRDDPWTRQNLASEMYRTLIAGRFVDPITARAALVTAFRAPHVSTTWREVGLFDSEHKEEKGDVAATSCDSLNSDAEFRVWTTGVGNTIIADPTGQVEGFGILRAIVSEDGSNTLFQNEGVKLKVAERIGVAAGFPSAVPILRQAPRPTPVVGQTVTLPRFDAEKARLQCFFAVDRVDEITDIKLRLFNHDVDLAAGYYEWTVLQADLSAGANFLDLPFVDAVATNSPAFDRFQSFQMVYTGSLADWVCSLDAIRIYEDSGTMLARAELYPPVVKGRQTLIVTWVIEPFPSIA